VSVGIAAPRCPSCAAPGTPGDRFCSSCGAPFEPPGPGSARERARMIKPQYAEGELVRVAWARHQAEAELIQGLLLEEGVPSVVRRAPGFDVPDFLAAGPRDVLVAESGLDVARDVLRIVAPDGPPARPREGTPAWVQAMAVTLIVVVLVATAAGVGLALLG
jgi:hypothetical protein